MMRFYFFDMEGKEIKTELSNLQGASCGASIAIQDSKGKWVMKMFDTPKGKLWARTDIGVFVDQKYNTRGITINDFPGHDAILVKDWSPNGSEWFVLTTIQESEEHADKVPMFG